MRKLYLKKVDNAWKRISSNSKGNIKIFMVFLYFFGFKSKRKFPQPCLQEIPAKNCGMRNRKVNVQSSFSS